MRNFLFFSKSDKIGVCFLCAIVLALLIVNVSFIRYDEKQALETFLDYDVKDVVDEVSASVNDDIVFITNFDSVVNDAPKVAENAEKKVVKKDVAHEIVSAKKVIVDLNIADSVVFTSLRGIGPVLASRIVKYRSRLGGYAFAEQLLEVYGLKNETFDMIKKDISVDTSLITKIQVNTAAFKQIMRHPYFNYDTTLIIVRARDQTPFTSIEDFSSRTGITEIKKLAYISVD